MATIPVPASPDGRNLRGHYGLNSVAIVAQEWGAVKAIPYHTGWPGHGFKVATRRRFNTYYILWDSAGRHTTRGVSRLGCVPDIAYQREQY